MNYYKRNRDKILKEARDQYHNGGGKEKARTYYKEKKENVNKRERERYRKWISLRRKTK